MYRFEIMHTCVRGCSRMLCCVTRARSCQSEDGKVTCTLRLQHLCLALCVQGPLTSRLSAARYLLCYSYMKLSILYMAEQAAEEGSVHG